MLRLAELCAGYGGLGMGLELAGIDCELVWYSERNPDPKARTQPAAQVMAHHYPTTPNLGDLRDITRPEPVDIITAGFPCQPVSTAGRRAGVDDDRWLVDDVCRVARLAGARTLILENVAGILTANNGDAMAAVCAAMAREGFSRWEWRTLRASDIGAPHQRNRWFCVAYSDGATVWPEPVGESRGCDTAVTRPDRPTTTDPEEIRWRPGRRLEAVQGTAVRERPTVQPGRLGRPCGRPDGAAPAYPDTRGFPVQRLGGLREDGDPFAGRDVDRCLRARFGGYAEAVGRWEQTIGRPAPEPAAGGRLNPVFVEWMMGVPVGHVTGCGLTRPEAVQVLGNGVVPQQAAAAIRMLTTESDF